MTSVDIETIDQLLKEWHETKLQIALLGVIISLILWILWGRYNSY